MRWKDIGSKCTEAMYTLFLVALVLPTDLTEAA